MDSKHAFAHFAGTIQNSCPTFFPYCCSFAGSDAARSHPFGCHYCWIDHFVGREFREWEHRECRFSTRHSHHFLHVNFCDYWPTCLWKYLPFLAHFLVGYFGGWGCRFSTRHSRHHFHHYLHVIYFLDFLPKIHLLASHFLNIFWHKIKYQLI